MKIKRADHILPEVYGTTLMDTYIYGVYDFRTSFSWVHDCF
jgi:hypothetical protein